MESLESSACLTWQLGCLDGVSQRDSRLLPSEGSNSCGNKESKSRDVRRSMDALT